MFLAWRYQLKEAQAALDQGRLEDSAAILERERLTDYAPGKLLKQTLAACFAERGATRSASGDFPRAWRDLALSAEMGGESSSWIAARQSVVHDELAVLQKLWRAGDFRGAWSRIETLEKNPSAGVPAAALKEVSRRLESARKLAVRAKFAEAEEQFAAAEAVQPELPLLPELLRECRENRARANELEERLHTTLAAGDWTAVLAAADQFLAFAPDAHIARDARRRAWGEVGASLGDTHLLPRKPSEENAEPSAPRSPRFILWIDAAGGYMVCLGDQILIGQAQPSGEVDVPIQADISRRHVRIIREQEGYLLEPIGPVRINGRTISGLSLLRDGDELDLGNAVRMRFRRPHAYSSSARLEFLSRHRTQPFSDGVILMAEACILGPDAHNHIVCRNFTGNVILFREKQDLACRAAEPLEIDGKLIDGRGRIELNSSVAGSAFAMKLERV